MKKIVLDWLAFTIKYNGVFNVENDCFDVDDCTSIAQYERGFTINYKGGQTCARLYLFNKLNKQLCNLKIENWCFYRSFSIGKFLDDFFENVGFEFCHVQRMDIACDTDNTLYCGKDPQKFCYGVWRGGYRRESRFNRATKKITLDHVQLIGSKEAETLKIGKSGITLKIYNKTKELINSGKEYIIEWWGGGTAAPVWRAEISLLYEDLQRVRLDGEIFDYSFLNHSIAAGFPFEDQRLIENIFYSILRKRYRFWIPKRGGANVLTDLLQMPENQDIINISKRDPKNYDILPNTTYHRGVANYMYRAASVMGNDEQGQQMAAAAYDLQNFKGGARANVFRTIENILEEERKYIHSKVDEAGILPDVYVKELDAVNHARQFFKNNKIAFWEAVSNTD